MTKAKKTKAPVRKTPLDRIAAQLHTVLRRRTTDVILAGNLLIEARTLLANQHGEWMPWLAENFAMSQRTAQNYCAAAEYVVRQKQIGNVANFSNLSSGLLYELAEGRYNEEEEAAILAATRTGRVGRTRAAEICDALAPPEPDEPPDDVDDADKEAAEDPEIDAILDGPPPAVPPPEPVEPRDLRDLQLAHFDRIVTELLPHVTKPLANTEGTKHSDADLERLADFIATVRDRRAARSAAAEAKANPVFAVFARKVTDQINNLVLCHLLEEVEKALALIITPEDRAALRRIDSALEGFGVAAANWRRRLTPKEPDAVPPKLLKKEP